MGEISWCLLSRIVFTFVDNRTRVSLLNCNPKITAPIIEIGTMPKPQLATLASIWFRANCNTLPTRAQPTKTVTALRAYNLVAGLRQNPSYLKEIEICSVALTHYGPLGGLVSQWAGQGELGLLATKLISTWVLLF